MMPSTLTDALGQEGGELRERLQQVQTGDAVSIKTSAVGRAITGQVTGNHGGASVVVTTDEGDRLHVTAAGATANGAPSITLMDADTEMPVEPLGTVHSFTTR